MLGFSIAELGQRPAIAGNGPVVLSFLTDSLPTGVVLSRASTGTRINSVGVLEVVGNNQPRFDYDPQTLAPRGLLVEPASTNLVHGSEPNLTDWADLVSTSTPLALNALGYFSGMSVAGSGAKWHRLQADTDGWSAGQNLRVRVWYMAGTSGAMFLSLRNVDAGVDSSLSGTVGALGVHSAAAGAITDIVNAALGGGVYTVTYTFTPNAGSTSGKFGIGPFSAISGETVVALGVKVEDGTGTTYVPTSGAAATRAADSVTLNDWNGVYDIALTYDGGGVEIRNGVTVAAGYDLAPTGRRIQGVTLTPKA
jgi:hypothetical protein